MGGAPESALMQFAFRQRSDFPKEARIQILVFCGCILLGAVDQWLQFHAGGLASPLSIGAGFAFACLLRFSWKVLPAIGAGLLGSEFFFPSPTPGNPVLDTLAVLVGFSCSLFLLHKWHRTEIDLEDIHDILGPFVFCAGLVAGVAVLLMANVRLLSGLSAWPDGGSALLRDFFSLLAGISLFAPGLYLLLLGRKYLSSAEGGALERGAVIGALLFSLVPAGIMHADLIDPGLLVAAPLPVLVWMSLRFGLQMTSTGIVIAVMGTLVLRYSVDSSFPEGSLLENGLYHFFACLSGVTLLILALQRDSIAKEKIRTRLSLAAADYCAWDWTFEGGLFFRSPAWAKRIGVTADRPFPLEAWIATVHPDEHEQFAAAINAGAKGTRTFNMRFRSRDLLLDEWFWSKSIGLILRTDANGKPLQAVGIIVDINDAYETESVRLSAAQKDAELTALRSQLNPHFLFNCLNSIRALIGLDAAKAREMITTLSVLLRYQLRAHRESLDTVEAEMAVVERYLQIEQTRFGKRLTSTIEVDPRSLQCTIPGMLILTLVENAVKHGISKLADGGLIHIETRMSKRGLVIRVVNTGSLELSEQGVGLENTRRRIKLLAGQFASFDIHEIRFGMVEAEIVLPRESLNASMKGSEQRPVEATPYSI